MTRISFLILFLSLHQIGLAMESHEKLHRLIRPTLNHIADSNDQLRAIKHKMAYLKIRATENSSSRLSPFFDEGILQIFTKAVIDPSKKLFQSSL